MQIARTTCHGGGSGIAEGITQTLEGHQPGTGSVQKLLLASQITRRRLQLAVRATCIFCTLAVPPGYGCQDYGWQAGVRVLMFLRRITGKSN